MFRANRIGTPNIMGNVTLADTSNWAPSAADRFTGNNYNGNVINAVPVLDFGQSHLRWDGAAAEAIASGNRFGLVQQFTVTAPQAGNVVGVELIAAITGSFPASATFIPYIIRNNGTAPATLLSSMTGANPLQIAQQHLLDPADDTLCLHGHYYKTQVVISNDPAAIYGHGFMIADNSGAGYNLEFFHMMAAVRQLNDQQNIEYRDTRR